MQHKPAKDTKAKVAEPITLRSVLLKMSAARREIAWVSVTFLVVTTVFLISLMPQQIRVVAGDVSPIDVKAPREIIDTAATDRLREEAAANVSEQWEKDPKVLADLKVQVADFRRAVAELQAGTPTTQEIIGTLRPYLSESASDADIIAVTAAQPDILDRAASLLTTVLDEGLSAGIKSENLAAELDNMIGRLTLDNDLPAQISKVMASFVAKNLKPNWVLNQERTERERRSAVEAVEPVRIRRGSSSSARRYRHEDQMAILVELGMVGSPLRFSAVAGALLMSVLVLGVLWGYLRIHHPDVFKSDKIAVLASVLIVSVVVIRCGCVLGVPHPGRHRSTPCFNAV